jgi:glycosyltransferase involved in cell wall biosynthesis
MKNILIITQKVDRNDSVLGFFHEWLLEFAKHYDMIHAVCLFEGESHLPHNVMVHSLGKEKGASRFTYIARVLSLSWKLRHHYDAVFVHMNEEYILVAGLLWRILGKKIGMWRNHAQGSWKTYIAAMLSNVIFYTSPQSFTARFKKAIQMPVGIPTDFFKPTRQPPKNSILYLGRISPVKNIHALVEACRFLSSESYTVTIAGDPASSEDKHYREALERKARSLDFPVVFRHGVPYKQTLGFMTSHEIVVSLTPEGSFDKIVFEAMAAGALLVTANTAFKDILLPQSITTLDPKRVAAAIEKVSQLGDGEKEAYRKRARQYVVDNHSLEALTEKVISIFQSHVSREKS